MSRPTAPVQVGGEKIAVITVVAGRHEHLAAQLEGLARSVVPPWKHFVVSMGDDDIAQVLRNADSHAVVLSTKAGAKADGGGPLPLAYARNLGARTAVERGADILVFLDVDCIPGSDMLGRYAAAARSPEHRHHVLCGPVTYLPPRPAGWSESELNAHTSPHPARPNPPSDTVVKGRNYDLFWSLSFALVPETWRTIGGFHEGYSGYGGEDTDFAAMAHARNVGLRWVGGAHAYHQYHPVSNPPVEHLDDIIENSAVFFRRWKRWPMQGWLDEFEQRGSIRRTAAGTIERTSTCSG